MTAIPESHSISHRIIGVIPARYASTRFPAKPLADIGGKSMIRRVYEQAKKTTGLTRVIVATDHKGIFDHVVSFGGQACMTSEAHVSGTDRCFEALTQQADSFDYLVNIQGDEPFIDPKQINLLVSLLDGRTKLATLIKRIENEEQLFNPNVVKVVVNRIGQAIYFSRTPLPHLRNTATSAWLGAHTFFKHIGMYAYRTDVLQQVTKLPPSMLEKAESLEQLRWIENGLPITTAETNLETIGIDTPDDLANATKFLQSGRLS